MWLHLALRPSTSRLPRRLRGCPLRLQRSKCWCTPQSARALPPQQLLFKQHEATGGKERMMRSHPIESASTLPAGASRCACMQPAHALVSAQRA